MNQSPPLPRGLHLAPLLALLLLFSCGEKKSGFERVIEKDEPINTEVTLRDFTTTLYNRDTLNWTLKSDAAFALKENNQVKFDKLYIEYYDKIDGKITMQGEQGVFAQTQRVMVISGNVVVKSSNGRRLYSEKLTWNEKKGTINTDEDVKIVYPGGDVLYGKGMEADQDLNRIVIYEGGGTARPK